MLLRAGCLNLGKQLQSHKNNFFLQTNKRGKNKKEKENAVAPFFVGHANKHLA